MPKITRALISVTDKTGIVELGKVLQAEGVEILSTGGTAKALRDAGISVIDVAAYTGSPEILDGRLKTLHPIIEGGILGIRSNPKHQEEMKKEKIKPIDLVVVNLYEFEKTVADPKCSLEHAIENIDIGGPTMLRAAAKNHLFVTVVCDPTDYPALISELQTNKGVVSEKTNFTLAVKVFQKTAGYDGAIAGYLTKKISDSGAGLPGILSLNFKKIQDLRYGENPHQKAAVYKSSFEKDGIIDGVQLQGKELSYNNYADLDSAYRLVSTFEEPAVVIVKHANPCGVAIADKLVDAFIKAKECDPLSSFGGIVGLNRTLDGATAKIISETFFECIVAPDFDPEALGILSKKTNLRLLKLEIFKNKGSFEIKKISGGLLLQDADDGVPAELKVVTKRRPTPIEMRELQFAWRVVKQVKSNAIVFTRDGQTLGIGAGQMSRVDSVKLAALKSQKSLAGAVMASDAFFPFRDGLDEAARMGIKAVIQPGGSVKDSEVIEAADEHGIAMVFTGMRHFLH